MHLPFLWRRPFFFGDDFGCLADADNLVRGSSRFFDLPAWGVWRLGQRAFWWAEYRLFGLDPLPYHAVNIALHAAVVVSLGALLVRFGAPRARALLAGALLAAFSATSMTVRYPSVSAVIVATLGVAAALAAWRRGQPSLCAAAMILGACFYEQALCVPAAILIADLSRGRRPDWRRFSVPVAAAAVFLAVNFWSLRGTAKVFAYNTGGARAILQAVAAPLVAASDGWAGAASRPALAGAVLVAAAALGLAWRPARGLLPGLLFAWAATVPLLGRNVSWPEWYYYMPGLGAAAALALAFPGSRLWTAACLVLLAVNLRDQASRAGYFATQSANYRQVTLDTPAAGEITAVILVNVHSGLAWTAWQFGGAVEVFELWDAPAAAPRCYPGRDLAELRARMLAEIPDARRRSRWPDDLPAGMRGARAPARREIFPWPASGH